MSHICMFLPDLNGGGAERVFLTLSKKFAARGHQVDLVLARKEGALLELVSSDVNVVDLSSRLRFCGPVGLAFSTTLHLAAYLHRAKPEVILSSLTGCNLVAVVARIISATNIRLVLREAATLANIKSHYRLPLMRWLYPKADAVIALTNTMRHDLIETLGLQADRVISIPNPIDIDAITLAAEAPLDHPWLNPHEIPVIIAIGRLTPQKDFTTLIKAFANLLKKHSARLVILGTGPQKNELQSLIKQLKLDSHILLAGFDSNPYRWLARASLFVLTSRWEGQPNSVLEAIALGKPIVLTSYDASTEVFRNQQNLALVRPGDIVEISNAMSTLLNISMPSETVLPFPASKSIELYLNTLTQRERATTERETNANQTSPDSKENVRNLSE